MNITAQRHQYKVDVQWLDSKIGEYEDKVLSIVLCSDEHEPLSDEEKKEIDNHQAFINFAKGTRIYQLEKLDHLKGV